MGSIRSVAVGVALVGLSACSGSAFTQGSPAGSDLGGAAGAAGASSIGTGGSSMPSGAAGQGGKPVASSGSAGGGSGTGGELEPAAAGAGGEHGQPAEPTACDRSSWQLTAFASSTKTTETPAAALDGSLDSRWSSGVPRAVGQWLELALGSSQHLVELELRTPAYPSDLPSSLVVKLDGKATPATFDTTTPGVLRVKFSERTARLVRLELEAEAVAWWSVSELEGLCR